MASATASMRSTAFGSSVRLSCKSPFRAAVAPLTRSPVVQVSAMADDKKAKKRTDSAVKRAMLGKERRLVNKARRSACATRIKKVLKLATSMLSGPAPATEADVKPLETLISEAYQEIDKAVSKDILHKNNAARKKARLAKYKRHVLMSAGIFVPPPDHPDYKAYQRLQEKKTAA